MHRVYNRENLTTPYWTPSMLRLNSVRFSVCGACKFRIELRTTPPYTERRDSVCSAYSCAFVNRRPKLPSSWVVLGSWSNIFLWLLSCKFLWGAD